MGRKLDEAFRRGGADRCTFAAVRACVERDGLGAGRRLGAIDRAGGVGSAVLGRPQSGQPEDNPAPRQSNLSSLPGKDQAPRAALASSISDCHLPPSGGTGFDLRMSPSSPMWSSANRVFFRPRTSKCFGFRRGSPTTS